MTTQTVEHKITHLPYGIKIVGNKFIATTTRAGFRASVQRLWRQLTDRCTECGEALVQYRPDGTLIYGWSDKKSECQFCGHKNY